MLAKLVAEVIKSTIQGYDPAVWGFWDFYLILTLLIFCLVNQMNYLNRGLRRYDVLILVPLYQVLWIFFNILGGAIFYDEFACFDTLQAIFFPAGTLLTWVGIYILMKGRKTNEDIEDAPPEEAAVRGVNALRRMTLQHEDFVMESRRTMLFDENGIPIPRSPSPKKNKRSSPSKKKQSPANNNKSGAMNGASNDNHHVELTVA